MFIRTAVLLVIGLAALRPAAAQPSPYVDRATSPIKALTADEIAGYLAGDGMGFALAAELNGYPGPRHVLELADSLGLSVDRRAAIQQIFEAMQTSARDLGAAIVAREAGLDSAFAERRVTRRELDDRLSELADLRGRLRFAHLAAHLAVTDRLSAEEVRAYQRLRGYGAAHDHAHHEGAHP
jgi:hypothetical protein